MQGAIATVPREERVLDHATLVGRSLFSQNDDIHQLETMQLSCNQFFPERVPDLPLLAGFFDGGAESDLSTWGSS